MKGIVVPVQMDYARHVYHQYTIRVLDGRRDTVQKRLEEAGISTMVYYPVPLHQLPIYADLGFKLPEAERAAAEVLSLPMWPQITPAIQARVVDALRAALL